MLRVAAALGSYLCLLLADFAAATLDDASSMIQGRTAVVQLDSSSSNSTAQVGVYGRSLMGLEQPMMGQPMMGQPMVGPPVLAQQPMLGFDCNRRPQMCKEPFHCERPSSPSEARERIRTMAKRGHSNFHTWCRNRPYWDTLVQHCLIEKDPVKGAWSMYYQARRGELGQFTDEMDASYCFSMGHCTNEAVTASTTPKEAEKLCDQRFGHRLWAHDFGYQNTTILQSIVANSLGFTTSPSDQKMAKSFVVMSCAMGNYHCDVMYCKETYCKNNHYIERYKHLQPRKPGHKLRQTL